MIECLEKMEDPGRPLLSLLVLRNVVVEPIEPFYRWYAAQIGFNVDIEFGNYDLIVQESMGVDGTYFERRIDCVLLFMQLETFSTALSLGFASLKEDEVIQEVERTKGIINSVLLGLRQQTNSMILWHGFELPNYPSCGVEDSQNEFGQLATIASLNRFTKRCLAQVGDAYFSDLNLCVRRIGEKNFYDRRYWHIGRAPYSKDALHEIAHEDFKFIRALKTKNKKCLVLDCDDTLWGGIVGEDGFNGIAIGPSYPGSAYYEFQQEILNLYHRGIIIAICSKNNEDDVLNVFRDHPDMLLREKHIASFQINWNDKAENIQLIADELNIGLDSIVFLDDSPFEVEFVERCLPEVEAICLPIDHPSDYRQILGSSGLFDTLALTEEDRQRGVMYQGELARRKARESYSIDMGDFYRSLEMVVEIRHADDYSIPRIAQILARTNQFSLTEKRYSELAIRTMVDADDGDIACVRLSDKFGSMGIVGAVILSYHGDCAVIENFVMSCRALGRGVEDVLLEEAIYLAGNHGKYKVLGKFVPTKKNMQVRDFYGKHKFVPEEGNKDIMEKVSSLSISDYKPLVRDQFKKVSSELS